MNALTIQMVPLKNIISLRYLFLQEMNCQIRYHACHERNWSDTYLFSANEQAIGYGSVKGLDNLDERNTIFEFYVLPPFRKYSEELFQMLLSQSGASHAESQSNTPLLTSLLHTFSSATHSPVSLFENHYTSSLSLPHVQFRKRQTNDDVFGLKPEDVGDYVLVQDHEVVATGGFLLHYNAPFADLFMEVKKTFWGQGLGSYLVQELKKACYLSGRVPAARCNKSNKASQATLLKAGMRVCGHMLVGKL